eukprot:5263905-Alexandrium_andersonii.AAC.1
MSASLVGSEMCIRDRRIADWRIADWSLRVGEFATSDPLEARFRGLIWSCLLYTSDAADDM